MNTKYMTFKSVCIINFFMNLKQEESEAKSTADRFSRTEMISFAEKAKINFQEEFV